MLEWVITNVKYYFVIKIVSWIWYYKVKLQWYVRSAIYNDNEVKLQWYVRSAMYNDNEGYSCEHDYISRPI